MKDYRNFIYTGTPDIIINHVHECYTTTKSGAFKRTPDTVKSETITGREYQNFVTSIPFFAGFWGDRRGYCRTECGYTYAGYIPIKITTITPWRDKKYIDRFSFEIVR